MATARDYYIHPKVLEVVTEDNLDRYESELDHASYQGSYFKKSEALALKILE